jgi:hypothetical protein
VVLHPTASQDLCQGWLQGLEELRSLSKGSIALALPALNVLGDYHGKGKTTL